MSIQSLPLTVLAGVPICVSKVLRPEQVGEISSWVRTLGKSGTVVFLDTPPTQPLRELIANLCPEYRVVLVDHHDIDGDPANPFQKKVRDSVDGIRALIGDNARISNRTAHPACSLLVNSGEFADVLTIVCDDDPDGWLSAIKAVGGEGLLASTFDNDGAVLDGPRTQRHLASPLAQLLSNVFVSLPTFEPANPGERQALLLDVFNDFANAITGDEEALARLEARKAAVYDVQVSTSQRLVDGAKFIARGVALVDVGSTDYDIGTLEELLSAMPGAVVNVTRKKKGPIAEFHGEQVTIKVADALKREINAQDFLPAGVASSPQSGVIANLTFMVHVSGTIFDQIVLPALVARFGSVE